ncbi:MAG TPA: hypothetical protein VGO07_02445 [Candidatus Saccharimonadales bacterium]|jgi:hypothetical protein|nr:hypothetical protein [Candidatus Saccharimonadales bacterium]
MIIVLHILIALTSLVQTTYVYFKPSSRQLRASYLLVALTMLSGFYLVATRPGSIAQACSAGLVYLLVVSFGIAGATHKLSVQRVRSDRDDT